MMIACSVSPNGCSMGPPSVLMGLVGSMVVNLVVMLGKGVNGYCGCRVEVGMSGMVVVSF